jgi:hypothetical protein
MDMLGSVCVDVVYKPFFLKMPKQIAEWQKDEPCVGEGVTKERYDVSGERRQGVNIKLSYTLTE